MEKNRRVKKPEVIEKVMEGELVMPNEIESIIKENFKDNNCKDMTCLVCGAQMNCLESQDYDRTLSEVYQCHTCKTNHLVFFQFHSTTNSSEYYEFTNPTCSKCGSNEFDFIDHVLMKNGLIEPKSCDKCNFEWNDYFKFDAIFVYLGKFIYECRRDRDVYCLPYLS